MPEVGRGPLAGTCCGAVGQRRGTLGGVRAAARPVPGDVAGCAEWLTASLPADAPPFDRTAVVADLETLAEAMRTRAKAATDTAGPGQRL